MIIPAYTLSILGMLLAPLLLAGLARRWFRPPWLLFSIGMLIFGLSQVLHIPFNNWLSDIGWIPADSLEGSQPLWRTALTLGLSAGIFEELARALGFAVLGRFPALRSQTTEGGLMFGLGHGGIESMIFGGMLTTASIAALLPMVGSDLTALNLPQEQLSALQNQLDLLTSSPLLAIYPFIERLLAIGLHVTFSMMVLRAFQRRQPGWVVLAIAYHALVDAALVYAVTYITNPLLIEGLLALLALPGYIWLISLLKQAKSGTFGQSPRREMVVLGAALGKEMLQQARTGRLVVIGIAMGLFGMISPLIAYMTPQLFNMIPGAEAFVDLIPTPTGGDAMMQYHKNLTQFGFIIVLLLGMGAVAGEKESGAAGIVLSKPLTRWAFLLSKLLAQTIALAGGLLIAMLGAYAYTAYLFGTPDFTFFGAMNLVLLMWILPYVALTLLGSVLGKSTASGAGISLAGMVLLLGISSLPTLAAFMPGALSAWAARLGILAVGIEAATPGAQVAANPSWAALIMALILVLFFFYTALGIFEQQEL